MRILIVSSYLPYPLFNGGNIRLYNLIKNLGIKHEITLICEKRKYQTEKDVAEVKKFCKEVITFPRKKQWSIKNVLMSAISSDPFLVIGHNIPEMKARIRQELIEKNFDLIHVETFYVLQNLPSTELPIILAEHNVEYLVYKRFSDDAVPWVRSFLRIDISKLERKETEAWKKVSRVLAVSEKEKEIIQNIVGSKVEIIPNGVDLELYKFLDPKLKFKTKDKRTLFIGDFKWIENINSAKWIINEIWPKIKTKITAKLWIVGRNIPENLRKIEKDVIFSSNLENTPQVYEKTYVLLSPIRVGGGTSFKILEAMASGTPVVTTTLGAEGIGNAMITAESSQGLADKVIELFVNTDLYERTSKRGRDLVEEKYDWKKITSNLEKVYSEVLE